MSVGSRIRRVTVEKGSAYGTDDAEDFFAVCRRMRLEGAKRIAIDRAGA